MVFGPFGGPIRIGSPLRVMKCNSALFDTNLNLTHASIASVVQQALSWQSWVHYCAIVQTHLQSPTYEGTFRRHKTVITKKWLISITFKIQMESDKEWAMFAKKNPNHPICSTGPGPTSLATSLMALENLVTSCIYSHGRLPSLPGWPEKWAARIQPACPPTGLACSLTDVAHFLAFATAISLILHKYAYARKMRALVLKNFHFIIELKRLQTNWLYHWVTSISVWQQCCFLTSKLSFLVINSEWSCILFIPWWFFYVL